MKILLTGAFNYAEEQLDLIEKLGIEVDFLQYEKDVIDNYESYDGVICNGLFLHHDIKKFKNLKYIQLTSVGYDRVPLEYIKKKNIKIYNAAGVYSIPIAEYTVLKILELYKKTKDFYKKQEEHFWEKERNIFELYGKEVAIIGCGNIGREIAKRLRGFGVHITAVDVVKIESPYIDVSEGMDNLYTVLKKSDIVVLTLPLCEETKGIINEECFEKMKKESILVNVSRGAIVNQRDLSRALENGKIYGAVLDVFENEPLEKESKLWDMQNVIITPHNSFVGENNSERMFDVMYKNLEQFIGGMQ